MSSPSLFRLGDLVHIKHGFAFRGEHFSETPTPFVLLTPGNFRIGGGFKSDKLKYYSGPIPPGYVLAPGDLVVTMTDLSKSMDTLGSPALVPTLGGGEAILHNQRIGLVQAKSAAVDLRWLSYRLRAPDYRAEVLASATGTTVHHTSPGRLEGFELLVPGITEQRLIAATLGALDAKIESNLNAKYLSLALAEAMFTRLASAAAVQQVGEVATIVLGGTPSRTRPEYWLGGTVPWINSGAANHDIILEPTELITEAALRECAAKLMPAGATVIAITGATLGQVALLAIETSGNQSLVGVWSDSESLSAWLHFALRSSIEELVKSATGAAQQHVNKEDVASLRVPVPDDILLAEWASNALPLMRQSVQLAKETQRLVALRDALLPELLSGRVRVPETQGLLA